MTNLKLKLFLLIIVVGFVTSTIIYLVFAQSKDIKIFGCTEYDIYTGSDHVRMPPKDIYCSLYLLDYSSSQKRDDVTVGLVEYDLNISGYITIFVIFALIPFVLSYVLVINTYKFILNRKKN